jgi:predicted DNA-binding transcriptional regulator AlpA
MRIISLDEAAARGNISRRTLDRAIKRGEGPPAFRLSPRRLGVAEVDFEKWLNSRRQAPATAHPVGGP